MVIQNGSAIKATSAPTPVTIVPSTPAVIVPSTPAIAVPSTPAVIASPRSAGLQSRSGLGIGVITYNRRETLKGTLAAIKDFTQAPYSLVVADDGSTDGTADWCREQGYGVMSGPNGGPGINKNRALFYLMTQTLCDPIILIEEDFRPTAPSWEMRWIEAAWLWHHVNVFLPEWDQWFDAEKKNGHMGTPEDPIWWAGFTGQCTVISRAALEQVGYIDPLLRGFGEEHVEWTRRFGRLLTWPTEPANEWHKHAVPTVPSIYAPDTAMIAAGTYFDAEQTRMNKDIHDLIQGGPIYRPPYRSQKDRKELIDALTACIVDTEYVPKVTTWCASPNAGVR